MSTSIVSPGSPSKSTSTLQRSNAMTTSMAYHQREKSIPGSDRGRSMFVNPPPQSPRYDRISIPPSPGKENYPLPSDNGKRALYGNAFETARSPSPTKVKPPKARARSVSPSKGMRLLGKGKSNPAQEQEPKQRDLRQIDHEYVEMLVSMPEK